MHLIDNQKALNNLTKTQAATLKTIDTILIIML